MERGGIEKTRIKPTLSYKSYPQLTLTVPFFLYLGLNWSIVISMKEFNEPPRGQRKMRELSMEKMKIVEEMWDKGYSYHQIRRFLNMKSVNAVYYYIKKIRAKRSNIHTPSSNGAHE